MVMILGMQMRIIRIILGVIRKSIRLFYGLIVFLRDLLGFFEYIWKWRESAVMVLRVGLFKFINSVA